MEVYLSLAIIIIIILVCTTVFYYVRSQAGDRIISSLKAKLLVAPKYGVGDQVWVNLAGQWVQDIIVESKLTDNNSISVRTRAMDSGVFYPISSHNIRLDRGETTSSAIKLES